jgi:hypothetical protein
MEIEKFKVEIKSDKKYGMFDLIVTNNGYQWMSITLRNREHLKKIRCAITNFLDASEQNEKPEGQVQLEQLVRQLPSNKEIMDEACTRKYNYGNDISAFAAGAKWMREQARQSA